MSPNPPFNVLIAATHLCSAHHVHLRNILICHCIELRYIFFLCLTIASPMLIDCTCPVEMAQGLFSANIIERNWIKFAARSYEAWMLCPSCPWPQGFHHHPCQWHSHCLCWLLRMPRRSHGWSLGSTAMGTLFPATPLDPQTCATFEVLYIFHTLNLQGHTSGYDFYKVLEFIMDPSSLIKVQVSIYAFSVLNYVLTSIDLLGMPTCLHDHGSWMVASQEP